MEPQEEPHFFGLEPQEEPLDLSKNSFDFRSSQKFETYLLSSVTSTAPILEPLDRKERESAFKFAESTTGFLVKPPSTNPHSTPRLTEGDYSNPVEKMEEPPCGTTSNVKSFELYDSSGVELLELPASFVVCNPADAASDAASKIDAGDQTTATFPQKTRYEVITSDISEEEEMDMEDVDTTRSHVNSPGQGDEEFIMTDEGPPIPPKTNGFESEEDVDIVDLTSDVEVIDLCDDDNERVQPDLSNQEQERGTLCSSKSKSCYSEEVPESAMELEVATFSDPSETSPPRKRPRPRVNTLHNEHEDEEAMKQSHERLRNDTANCPPKVHEPDFFAQSSSGHSVSNTRAGSPQELVDTDSGSCSDEEFNTSKQQTLADMKRLYAHLKLKDEIEASGLQWFGIPQCSPNSDEQDFAAHLDLIRALLANNTIRTANQRSLPKKLGHFKKRKPKTSKWTLPMKRHRQYLKSKPGLHKNRGTRKKLKETKTPAASQLPATPLTYMDCLPPKKRFRRSTETAGEFQLRKFVTKPSMLPWTEQFTNVFDPRTARFVHVNGDASTIQNEAKLVRKRCHPSTNITDDCTLRHIIFRGCHFEAFGQTTRQSFKYFMDHGYEVVSLAFQDCTFSECNSIQKIVVWCSRLKALSISNCPTFFQNLKENECGRKGFLDCLKRLRRLEIYDEKGCITNGRLDNISEIGEQILQACGNLHSVLLRGEQDSLPIIVTAYLDNPKKVIHLNEIFLDFSGVKDAYFPDYIIRNLHQSNLSFTNIILKNISFNCKRAAKEEEDLAKLFNMQFDLDSVEFQSNFPFQRNSNFITLFPRQIKSLKFTSIEDCDEQGLEQLVLQSRHLESLTFVNTELSKMGTTFLQEYLCISNSRLRSLSLTLVGVGESERLNTSWNFMSSLPNGAPELTQLDLSGFSHGGLRPDNLDYLKPIFGLKKLRVLMLSSVDIVDEHLIGSLLDEPDLKATMNLLLKRDITKTRKAIRRRASILSLSDLQILGLANNSIGNRTLALLARFLPNLTKLDISHTLIGLDGLKFAVQTKKFAVLRAVGCKLPETFDKGLTTKLSQVEEFMYLDNEASRSAKPLNFHTSIYI